ncbi:MAG TPA: hypothetical protein VD969_14890 [Symbiobacteriaceae bacterium]|nr:hypothetical protein [Symbiobacteriaceae bacterium]
MMVPEAGDKPQANQKGEIDMMVRILIGAFLVSHGLVHLALKVTNSWVAGALGISMESLASVAKVAGQVSMAAFILVGLGFFGVPVLSGGLLKVLVVIAAAASLLFSVIAVNNVWIIAPLAINVGAVAYVFMRR